jgi:hypothetical protein
MRRQGRFRPIGWLVGAATVLAMLVTAVVAAPGGAATPEKEYKASFEMECVVGPGVLNIRAKEKLKVTTAAMGPERVGVGQEISFHHAHSTIESPVELTESFVSLGANEVNGTVTSFLVDATSLEPASLNIAKPAEYPSGLPFVAPVEKGKPSTFYVPSKTLGETTLTYEFGPEKVTAASLTVKTEVDSSPGFTETEPGSYKETGKGIVTEVEGRNSGAHVIGPLKTVCNAPSGVVLAEIPSNIPPTCTFTTNLPHPITVEPNHGPAAGGTTVLIGGASEAVSLSFGSTAVSFEHLSSGQLRAVTPPGKGTVTVFATGPPTPCPNEQFGGRGQFTYESPAEKAEYKNWKLSGAITDKKLGQAVTLPAGSTFNGSGEVNTETGAGSVKGNVSIPPFTSSLKLFGPIAVNVGLTLSATGPLEGAIAKSESVPGDETLSAPLKLNAGITSLGILGLTIPTTCATAEPLALNLMDTLTREELLTKGWSFTGTMAVPRVNCEGGFLSRLFGVILTGLLAGPEDPYSISITAPSG